MRTLAMIRCSLLALWVVMIFPTFFVGFAYGLEDRDHLAQKLKNEFALVKSMACSYECIASVTSPETVARLKELRKTSKYAQSYTLRQMTFSREDAEIRSYYEKWWRSGPQERGEAFPRSNRKENATLRSVYAFDGQINRGLSPRTSSDPPRAFIETATSGTWYKMNRATPFGWVYLFAEEPYWRIIKEATQFDAAEVSSAGQPLAQYTIRSSKLDNRTLVLRFDNAGRLVDRQWMQPPMPGDPSELCQRDEFSDYRLSVDSSGETIWFPYRVVYHFYAGRLPDGAMVEHGQQDFRVHELSLNPDIPDERFQLEIPKDAVVWDGISTMSYLDPGTPLPTYQPPAVRSAWWRWLTVGGVVAVLLLALIVVVRRRFRRITG